MFRIDDIVFARLEGFPFWPARVIEAESHHLADLGMDAIPPNQRLVRFYNDGGRFAAVDNAALRNFGDPRIQQITLDYDGSYKSQLHTAFKAARKHYSSSVTTNSPHQKQRSPTPAKPTRPTSSELTSPVTGHSESRNTTMLTKMSKCPNKLTQRSASSPQSPLPRKSLQKGPTPPNMASRTHVNSSPSTHPPASKQFQHTPTSIQLRLRLKRKSPALQNDSPLSPSRLSSHPPQHPSAQQTSSPKRRRVEKSHHTSVDHTNSHHKLYNKSNRKTKTDQPHKLPPHNIFPEKRKSLTKHNPRISPDRDRIPRLTHRKGPRHDDENRQRMKRDAPIPTKSRFEQRIESTGSSSQEGLLQSSGERDSDQPHRLRETMRLSKVRSRQLVDSDVDAEPQRKKLRPAANRSSSAERPRRSHEIKDTRVGDGDGKGEATEKVDENRLSMESGQISKSVKQKKTDVTLVEPLSPLHKLARGDCVELIERMQMMLRCNHVELWCRGYKLAETKDIAKTEEGLIAACDGAVQKAEELLKVLKSEHEEKNELTEREVKVYEACKVLREVYFDKDKVSLKKMGKRILDVAKEMALYSRMVSTVLRDLLVMWADLTEGCENSSGETEKPSPSPTSPEKKGSAREQRMLKFDRKTFFTASESVLKESGRILRMDEKEQCRFVRRLEREIRPAFEDDRQGYYEACLKVIRGVKKALKHLAVKGEKYEAQAWYEHTPLFVDAVRDHGREKTRQLVTRLRTA